MFAYINTSGRAVGNRVGRAVGGFVFVGGRILQLAIALCLVGRTHDEVETATSERIELVTQSTAFRGGAFTTVEPFQNIVASNAPEEEEGGDEGGEEDGGEQDEEGDEDGEEGETNGDEEANNESNDDGEDEDGDGEEDEEEEGRAGKGEVGEEEGLWTGIRYVHVEDRMEKGGVITESFGFLTANCWRRESSSALFSGGKTLSMRAFPLAATRLPMPSILPRIADIFVYGRL